MPEPEPKQAVHNAGAFLTPNQGGNIPIPMRTLSDDYHDIPKDPKTQIASQLVNRPAGCGGWSIGFGPDARIDRANLRVLAPPWCRIH